jgi:hypothetical protein
MEMEMWQIGMLALGGMFLLFYLKRRSNRLGREE